MSVHNVKFEINNAVDEVVDFKTAGIKADVIAESTAATGVTIDGVILKDGGMTTAGDVAIVGAQTVSTTLTVTGATVHTGGNKTLAVVVPNADTAILAADSGKIHLITNVSADRAFTLPTAAAGLYYKFWSQEITADGHDWDFGTGSATNFFIGSIMWTVTAGAGTKVSSDNDSNDFLHVVIPDGGTWLEMYCDGTNWFVMGHVLSATTPAFSDS